MNDQDLSINDCCDGQKTKNILKQLEDLTAMSLSGIKLKEKQGFCHTI